MYDFDFAEAVLFSDESSTSYQCHEEHFIISVS